MSKRKATNRSGSVRLSPAPCSTARTIYIGTWQSEDVWQRAEKCRVILAACGYMTMFQAEQVAKKIKADMRKRSNDDSTTHKP